jgi:cytochrome d ubiquinol oxidase subunit I
VPIVFFAFRLMVGIWLLMLAIALWGAVLRWRGRLYDTRWFAVACAFSSPLPFLAVLSGWTVTEVGRQPYVVYGYLRTAEAISPVATSATLASLAMFVIVYTILLLAFFFYATRLVFRGPARVEAARRAAATSSARSFCIFLSGLRSIVHGVSLFLLLLLRSSRFLRLFSLTIFLLRFF